MPTQKFFVMTAVNFLHETKNLPAFAPDTEALSYEQAYAGFAFDEEAAAIECMEAEEKTILESVESGDLTDADDLLVAAGVLNDDGSIVLDASNPFVGDDRTISAATIYDYFDLLMPSFAAATQFEIGQTVYVRLTSTEDTNTEALAYAPNAEASSFIEAYRASLYATREEAEAAIAQSFKELQADQAQEVADGGREPDECDNNTDEFVVEGVVNEDGSITFDKHFELAVTDIWERAGVEMPNFASSGPRI